MSSHPKLWAGTKASEKLENFRLFLVKRFLLRHCYFKIFQKTCKKIKQEVLTRHTWSTRDPLYKIAGQHSLNYPPSFLFRYLQRLVRTLVYLPYKNRPSRFLDLLSFSYFAKMFSKIVMSSSRCHSSPASFVMSWPFNFNTSCNVL